MAKWLVNLWPIGYIKKALTYSIPNWLFKPGKLRNIKLAAALSIPLWIIFIIDELLFIDRMYEGIIPAELYAPGFFLYIIISPILGGFNREVDPDIILITNCISYFLIIWLIVYIANKIRLRRKAER